MADSPGTPGYDQDSVDAWIRGNVDGLEPPFTWEKLEGGHSNLTYALTDQRGARAVIRRPPLGVLLPKAHDMFREFSVISAVGPAGVPVAEAFGYCEDPAITGAHFYVMSLVSGRAMYSHEDVDEWLPMEARTNVARSFIETLAALHSVDPDEVGLGQLGKKEGYINRQLSTWYKSWNASIEGAKYDDKRVHELQALLLSRVPEQGPARVVHGDYGMHNSLLDHDGKVTAVLDWEIATLGDPLADLAYFMNSWADPDDEMWDVSEAPTKAGGFSRRSELPGLYAEQTGRDLSDLDFYLAFNSLKTACILHGVYSRYMEGKKSTEGIDLEAMFERVVYTVDVAERRAASLQ